MHSRTVIAIPANSQAGQGDVAGPAIPADLMIRASVQGAFAGGTAPNGTLKLRGSNDIPPGGNLTTFTPTNWSDIANATVTVNALGAFATPVTEVCYRWLQAYFARTSGGGGSTFQANLHAIGYP